MAKHIPSTQEVRILKGTVVKLEASVASLLGRMLLLTLLAILLAQTLSSAIWLSQLRTTQLEGLVNSARSLAHSMNATVAYLRSLPLAYRPLVLDQLRSMGGTRFVVSLNDKPLDMQVLPLTQRKQAVLDAVDQVLREAVGPNVEMSVQFVSPQDLRIFNAGLKLDELPRSWAHFALTLEPVDPPILVTQIQMVPGEWLYIASLLPQPYTSLEEEGLPALQVWFIVLSSIFLLLFIGLLMHWQSRPLKRLAAAARSATGGPEPAAAVICRHQGLADLMEHRVLLLRLGQSNFVLPNLRAVTTARVTVHLGEQPCVAVAGITLARLGGATGQRQHRSQHPY